MKQLFVIAVAIPALFLAPDALGYPPAPHHLFYGSVRDEYGAPLNDPNATVVLETANGVQYKTSIVSGLEPGVNYRLAVAMDAGITSDLYKATALRPQMPFLIKVIVAGVTNLPIEMSGNLSELGQPGKRTLLNLTLGVDSDGDGLPDAWERLIDADITKVNPGDDSDGDRLSNLQEYLAGTYAFDPEDGFALEIVRVDNENPVVSFTAIRGRSYVIQGSGDLKSWDSMEFKVLDEGSTAVVRRSYTATDVRLLETEIQPADIGNHRFYRLLAQ